MKNLSRLFISGIFSFVMAMFISTITGLPGAALFIALIILSQVKIAQAAFMAITYPSACDEVELVHVCDECEDPELARIRGIAFIKNDFVFSNPALAAEWITGINNGDIIIIPFTRGSSDGGTPREGTGYGDQATKYVTTDYSLNYFDPNYKVNRDFYNNIKLAKNYKVAYKTETLVHITDKVAQVLPKAPVVDDISGEVVWEVLVKWSSGNEPTPFIAPVGIFSCFTVE